jgi:dienelactone hydrolase
MRKSTLLMAVAITMLAFSSVLADSLPSQPTSPNDPGSASYSYTLFHEQTTLADRDVEFFAPAEVRDAAQKVPLIVFAHGQSIGADNYRATFEHLAKKGVAVLYPTYDTGFFDQDWVRMGQDYVNLTALAVARYAQYVNPAQIVYSGHSKGGYIALTAAGVAVEKNQALPSSVVVFEPAGYEANYLAKIDPKIPVTVTFSQADTIIQESLVQEIYDHLPGKKQFIHVASYPDMAADHFFPLSQSFFMGGHDGVTPFHYYGVWKWLMGAAWDLQQNHQDNSYLYGSDTSSTGSPSLSHQVQRNW